MEPRLQRDFSGVRVHTDRRAQESARSVSARAYAVGQHVVFGAGQYRPETTRGRELIAHELVHTAQQPQSDRVATSRLEVGPANDPLEREAQSIARTVAASGRPSRAITAGQQTVQRAGDPTRVPADLNCPVATTSPASTFTSMQFPQNSADLTDAQKAEIQNVITAWEAAGTNPVIRVDGYASTEGTDEFNWRLSCRRAEAVVGELMAHTSGPPGIPASSIESFAHGETNEFSASALPPNRRAMISTSLPLPAPVCTHPGVSRTVELQPVFFRDSPTDASPTGGTWTTGLNRANEIWGKLGVTFNDLGAITLEDATNKTGGGDAASTNAVRATRTGGGVEVFFVDNDMAWTGGGRTFNLASAAAQTVVSDRPGTVSTLLAHELGHVLGLGHPGLPAPLDVEANTIMTPTGARTAAHTTRNPISNFRRIRFPAGSGSTCLQPDP